MQDQKNLILAIVLSVAILGAFQYFYEFPRLEREAAQQQAAQPSAPSESAPVAAAPSTAPSMVVPGSRADASDADETREQAIAEAPRARIESQRVSGSVSLAGGRFDDLDLLVYWVTIDPDSPYVTLLTVPVAQHAYVADFSW